MSEKMKKLFLLAALLVLPVNAHARTIENARFTCTGILKIDKGIYFIGDKNPDEVENPLECMIDDKAVRQILKVCVVESNTVSANGAEGNGNWYLIQHVFKVQK